MKISPRRRVLLGMMFLLLGGLWSGMVSARGTGATATALMQLQQTLEKTNEINKVRSPYVKDYHIVLFWFLVYLEVICAASYAVSGIALIRPYPYAKISILGSLVGDFIYKVSIVLYMYFCAIPIARLTGNPNLLKALYTPNTTITSKIYAYLSALKVYEPYGWIYGIMYGILLVYGIYYFSRWKFRPDWRGPK